MSEPASQRLQSDRQPRVFNRLLSQPLLCPYPNCEHHQLGKGFPNIPSLEEHIRLVHRNIIPILDADINDDYLSDDSCSVDDRSILKSDTVTIPECRTHTSARSVPKRNTAKVVDRNDNVTVSGQYLKEMETMIKDLQRRVDVCERGPESPLNSPVNSYPSSRRSSIDSIIEYDRGHGRDKRRPRRSSVIEIIEPDVIRIDQPYNPPPPRFDPRLPPHMAIGSGFNPPDIVHEGFVPNSHGGPMLDIMRWQKRANTYGDPEWHIDNEFAIGPAVPKDLSHKCLLTVIREFDRSNQFWRRRVQIASPAIIGLLKDLSQYDLELDSDDGPKGGELRLTEPLMVLFHSRKQLYSKMKNESTQIQHQVQLLLDFMSNEYNDVSRKLNDIESAKCSGLITYSDLWLLYPPGSIVYSRENGEYEAFVVDSLRGMQKRQRGQYGRHSHGRLDLTCWSINYDGEVYGRVWSVHTISPFHETREITSLDLVPERFVPERKRVKTDLISRGERFWSLQGQKFREYTGEIWSQYSSDEAVRVMVDHLTYQRRFNWPISIDKKRGPTNAQSKNWQDNRFGRWEAPSGGSKGRGRARRCPPPIIEMPYRREYSPERHDDREDRYDDPYRRYTIDRPARQIDSEFNQYDVLEPDSAPDDLTLLLCPQHAHGYCLRDKVWKELNVSQLQPVAFRKNAWNRVVLDTEYKDIIQAMVSSYVDKTAMLDDLVAGKGAGLVALLHGPPGSGKTLTAECVADSFEKPLYQVTCGDIGTDPERLEERLEEIFDYAVTWGAVLLLDEADIFLQDRDYANLERNALVSIFLRTLEYFNGVLFLTTNRVGTFDQAFQSRIHVTLGLPSLDQQRRTSVWTIFLQDLAAKGAITGPRYDSLIKTVSEKWSKEKLNGRQIRNAVRTALVVAEKKREMVGEKDFETVLKIGREFEGYMGMLGKGEVNAGLEGFQEV